jgi:vacuolar-type H+-ATPase subunit E/Vma4
VLPNVEEIHKQIKDEFGKLKLEINQKLDELQALIIKEVNSRIEREHDW